MLKVKVLPSVCVLKHVMTHLADFIETVRTYH